jgi:hypothetical protein
MASTVSETRGGAIERELPTMYDSTMLLRVLSALAVFVSTFVVVLPAHAAPSQPAVQTVCTMSGLFAESDGRNVHATLDLSHDNSDYRVIDSDYYFDASSTDDTTGSPTLYGIVLVDKTTGQVYAYDLSPSPCHTVSLTAVVSGGEFIGDGALDCRVITSPVDIVDLQKAMDDASVPLDVVSASYTDGPAASPQTMQIGQVAAAAGETVSVTGASVGESYDEPQAVHAADLDKVTYWMPMDPSHPEPVTASVPAGATGTLYWTQSVTKYVRSVTIRYGDAHLKDQFVKQRTFDVPMTKYGPIQLSEQQPLVPTPSEAPDPNECDAGVNGLFFTGKETGVAPVYQTIPAGPVTAILGSGAQLTPIKGQDTIVVTLGAALAPRVESAQWDDGAGGTVVQSVSSPVLSIPIPADTSDPIDLALHEMGDGVLDKKVMLPASVDWPHPEQISVDFAVLDGLDSLDAVLGTDTIWPTDDTIRNTCFVMIPETSLYAPMLLVPKSMAPAYQAAVLKQLDATATDLFAGRSWGLWGKSWDVYTVPPNGINGLFGNLEPELGQEADIGFTSVVAGSPCSVEFIRLLPSTPALPPLTASDAAVAIAVAGHESFHAFMIRKEIEKLSKAGQMPSSPPKGGSISQSSTASTINHMYDIDKELDSSSYVDAIGDLVQAYGLTDPAARMDLYRKAVADRSHAVASLSKDAASELMLEEDQEGSATYVGMTAQQALIGHPIPLEDRVPGGFGSIKTSPKGGRIPLFYQAGYLICLALNDIQPGWQTAWMDNTKSLSEMLEADVENVTAMGIGSSKH